VDVEEALKKSTTLLNEVGVNVHGVVANVVVCVMIMRLDQLE